jgi:hypothetical protein
VCEVLVSPRSTKAIAAARRHPTRIPTRRILSIIVTRTILLDGPHHWNFPRSSVRFRR